MPMRKIKNNVYEVSVPSHFKEYDDRKFCIALYGSMLKVPSDLINAPQSKVELHLVGEGARTDRAFLYALRSRKRLTITCILGADGGIPTTVFEQAAS